MAPLCTSSPNSRYCSSTGCIPVCIGSSSLNSLHAPGWVDIRARNSSLSPPPTAHVRHDAGGNFQDFDHLSHLRARDSGGSSSATVGIILCVVVVVMVAIGALCAFAWCRGCGPAQKKKQKKRRSRGRGRRGGGRNTTGPVDEFFNNHPELAPNAQGNRTAQAPQRSGGHMNEMDAPQIVYSDDEGGGVNQGDLRNFMEWVQIHTGKQRKDSDKGRGWGRC